MRTGLRFILEPPLDLDHCPNTRLLGGCFFGEMRDSGVPEKSSGISYVGRSKHWVKVKNRAHPAIDRVIASKYAA